MFGKFGHMVIFGLAFFGLMVRIFHLLVFIYLAFWFQPLGPASTNDEFISGRLLPKQLIYFLSTLLRNYFLFWDCWKGDATPTLDAAQLYSSRAGSDLGCEFGLG